MTRAELEARLRDRRLCRVCLVWALLVAGLWWLIAG